jgi:predicted nucleotidyltransferase
MANLTNELLDTIVQRVAASTHPDKIYLFGSHAWGEPDESSDVDLFVVVSRSDQPSYRRAVPVYRALRGLGVPVDVIVQTRSEVERSRSVRSSLARRVIEEGRVVYG